MKAKKKLLMWPWCVGLRGQGCQKSLWRVLERLKPGKRQAWTPVKSYWCRVEGQEKALDVALVPWPAGTGVPKEPLEGFGKFEAWQTAGLNASKKLMRSHWRPRKSSWCGLGALACGVRGAKRAFGGFWRVWSLANGRLDRQEKAIDVAFKAKKKLLMWPWCLGLRGQACQKGFWRVLENLKPGKPQASFCWRPRKHTLERHATKEPISTPPRVPGAARPQGRPGSADTFFTFNWMTSWPLRQGTCFLVPPAPLSRGLRGLPSTSGRSESPLGATKTIPKLTIWPFGIPSGKTMEDHHV